MTFLNPFVLFGLFAAAIPIVIHLLNLRKLQKIEFSTLTFLKELQKNKIRKIKIRQWLLLLLRTLIILFIVLAFSRPTIKGVTVGGAPSVAKTTAVFILDNSISMSAGDENGSFFNQAKAQVIGVLNSMKEGDNTAVILTGVIPETNQPVLSGNISAIIKELKDAEISDISTELYPSIVYAAELLAGSQNLNKELYIFTDLQKSRFGKENSFTSLKGGLDERVQIYLFAYGEDEIINLGVDSLNITTSIFEKDKPISVSAFIKNYSDIPNNNAVVSLFINGERTAQKSVDFSASEQKEIQLESTIKNTGYQNIYVSLEEDAIIKDNTSFASAFVPDKVKVALFEQNSGDGMFLELALKAGDRSGVISIEKKPLTQFNSIAPEKYNVIIIAGAGEGINTNRVKRFFETGGGLLIIPGNKTTPSEYSALLSSVSGSLVNGGSGIKGTPSSVAVFSTVNFDHPVLTGLFRVKEKKQIESPDIYYHLNITAPEFTPLIMLNTGQIFIAEKKSGRGKQLVLSCAVVPDWSNLPLKGFFAPFIFRAVMYLASGENTNQKYFAGEEIFVPLEKTTGSSLLIKRPGKPDETISVNAANESAFHIYKNTLSAGNYSIMENGKIVGMIPVNRNPLESRIERYSTDEFAKLMEKTGSLAQLHIADVSENAVEKISQARAGSELWKYCIMIALVLALIEMAVARVSKNESSG